ncbi:MAG: hypothetical protein FVQ82_03895 [Planctomycetes bacterium]|nr:hypothetical protein [Planctomycetota bacterium]
MGVLINRIFFEVMMKKTIMIRFLVSCLLISTLFAVTHADDLIYSNSISSGLGLTLGNNKEVYDFGTSSGGLISKFTFGYVSYNNISTLIVRFYTAVDTRWYDCGYVVKSIAINNLPSTGGFLEYYTHDILDENRFELPGGTFGYSFQWPDSNAMIALARGGTGNEDELWDDPSPSGSAYFEFGGNPWAGFDMEIYKGPVIEDVTCDIQGYKFDDLNSNGVFDGGEPYLQGWRIYIDSNGNNTFDATEPNSVTDPNGMYFFDNLDSLATYTIREVMKDGWTQTLPGGTNEYVLVTEPNNVYTRHFGNTQQTSNGVIAGKTFIDFNANEIYDGGDALDSGWRVYVDENENGIYDSGERYDYTEFGHYMITGVPVGTHTLNATIKSGYVRTFPEDEMTHTITIATGQIVNDIDFGHYNFPGYGGGSGTQADPYLISSAYQLQALGANKTDWNKHYKMTKSFYLRKYKGEEFNLIGRYNYYDQSTPFSGTFDGDGNFIVSFSYNYTGIRQEYIGLFGYVHGVNAEIKNLSMYDTNIDTQGRGIGSGAMIGYLESGTVSKCFVGDGSIKNDESNTGGIIGYCENGTITDCHASVDVENTGVFGTGSRGGGLIGTNKNGTVTGCSAKGSVTAHMGTGGLIGNNGGNVHRCYSNSTVNGFQHVGGLIGESNSDSVISECYSLGTVETFEDDFTGLDGNQAGGLAGTIDSGADIINCYSHVDVTGVNKIGGLVGVCSSTDPAHPCIITNSYSTGAVSATSPGGLIGLNIDGVITGCVWDKQTSGRSWSNGGVGKTTWQMQNEGTFDHLGWDLSSPVWNVCPAFGYPVLAWQNSSAGPGGVIEKWSSFEGGRLIDEGKKVLVDFEGNIVVITKYYAEHETEKNIDFMVSKYTPSGDKLWSETYDSDPSGDINDIPEYMAIDDNGNIYITGATNSSQQILTVKFSPSGVLVWARQYDGTADRRDIARGITVDASGNVYIAAETDTSSISDIDYCLIKYSTGGVFQWAKISDGGNNGDDYALGVTVDLSGNVYMAGDPDSYNTVSKIQTFKYNSAGVLQWQKDFDAPADTFINGGEIATDKSDNIYVSGLLYKDSDEDFLLLKYNEDGDLLWSEISDVDSSNVEFPRMALDDAGNIYLASATYSPATWFDYVIAKYSPEGTKLWHQTYNGPESQHDKITAITVGPDQSVYVTGISGYRHEMNRIVDGISRTQKYSQDGDLVWSIDHVGTQGSMTMPFSIAVGDRQVYITGAFEGATMYGDSGVICYAECSSNGDCNADFKVNFADFAVLAGQWLDTNCGECGKADWTGDGNVQADDLIVLANNWLWDINALDLAWDFNDDLVVNMIDYAMMAQAWQSEPGDEQWNKDCDLSQTKGVIDIEDLLILSEHWLEDRR